MAGAVTSVSEMWGGRSEGGVSFFTGLHLRGRRYRVNQRDIAEIGAVEGYSSEVQFFQIQPCPTVPFTRQTTKRRFHVPQPPSTRAHTDQEGKSGGRGKRKYLNLIGPNR